MLEPQERRLFLESLRAPEGYSLTSGLGTTYSLDLLALLTTPLAFTFFDWEDAQGRPVTEPLALIEAVRRNIEKLAIFCQADRIKVPPADQKLFAYLEDAVIPVAKPGGVFHPKVWLLRFEPSTTETADAPVLYRLLCLSRNLTFDRSWDTVLCLEGELLEHRERAISASRPLADFVAALPGLAVGPVPKRVATIVAQMQDEVLRVRFEAPEGFDAVAFWPLGIGEKSSEPFEGRIDRALVVSPFLSDQRLRLLSEQGSDHVLVARPEELANVAPRTLARFSSVRVLAEAATPEPSDTERAAPAQAELEGLHAKLYVVDQGSYARVFTGSANATAKAFSSNVEFLVELSGKKSRFGVEATLAQGNGVASFASLLQDYRAPEERPPADDVAKLLEDQLRAAREALVAAGYRAVVTTTAEGEYGLALVTKSPPRLLAETEARCWPITHSDSTAKPLAAAIDFGHVSFEALTAFFAFEVSTSEAGRTASERFVMSVRLDGAPADRKERILRSLLRDRDRVLRLLQMLLAEEGLTALALVGTGSKGDYGGFTSTQGERGLLESLLKALAHRPQQLDSVRTLVRDLQSSAETRELLPEGFERIWEPVWQVREKLRNE